MKREHSENIELPGGYKRLEYLYASGGQWIDTGYVFSDTDIKVEQKYRKMSSLANNTFGTDHESTPRRMHGNIYDRNAYLGNSKVISGTIPEKLNEDVELVFQFKNNTATWVVNGVTFTYVGTNGWSGAVASDAIFGTKRSSSEMNYPLTGRIYYHVMYDKDDECVRNFIPGLRISDNKPGMYDLCGSICPLTGTPFYVNMGTGEFLYQ